MVKDEYNNPWDAKGGGGGGGEGGGRGEKGLSQTTVWPLERLRVKTAVLRDHVHLWIRTHNHVFGMTVERSLASAALVPLQILATSVYGKSFFLLGLLITPLLFLLSLSSLLLLLHFLLCTYALPLPLFPPLFSSLSLSLSLLNFPLPLLLSLPLFFLFVFRPSSPFFSFSLFLIYFSTSSSLPPTPLPFSNSSFSFFFLLLLLLLKRSWADSPTFTRLSRTGSSTSSHARQPYSAIGKIRAGFSCFRKILNADISQRISNLLRAYTHTCKKKTCTTANRLISWKECKKMKRTSFALSWPSDPQSWSMSLKML